MYHLCRTERNDPMKKLARALAAILTLSVLAVSVGCAKDDTDSGNTIETDTTTDAHLETNPVGKVITKAEPNEIYWIADYDLNPSAGNERSSALALFEDQYNGKIIWVPCDKTNKYDVLLTRLNSEDPVDMIPFDVDAMPDGVSRELFDPLDDHLDLSDAAWDNMRDAIDMFAYGDKHYVVPYSVSDPLMLTYSRKLCKENGLDDPYTLYQQGSWDWNKLSEMMEAFTAGGSDRYGIAGWFEQGLLHSTGQTVVSFDGTQFINNIENDQIAAAEEFLYDMAQKGLYDSTWYNNYPTEGNVLFYAMSDWALGASNAKNPDADIMVVPFPKAPGAADYYYCGNYNAMMLARDSAKGDLVASYILCERTAAMSAECQGKIKEQLLAGTKNSLGDTESFVTEEQYNVVEAYKSSAKPIYEFGLGMGGMMYSNGMYTYETRGIMNNIINGLLKYPETGDTWDNLRDSLSPLVDAALSEYNLQ